MDLFVVRGTPHEIRELFPDIADVLAGRQAELTIDDASGSTPLAVDNLDENFDLPTMLSEYILRRARPAVAQWIEMFAINAIQSGAIVEIGKSRNSADGLNRYFMAYARGPRRLGAAAYVHPSSGRVDFRLPAEALTDADRDGGAFLRDVEEGNAYAVSVMLDGSDKWVTAQDLLRRAVAAIDAAGGVQ